MPERYALAGEIVTMNAERQVISDGVVWIQGNTITAVTDSATPPPGFEQIAPIASGGTLFPGFIELHNHLAYDVLPLWQVPQKYGDRDLWGGAHNPQYHPLISGPMKILGGVPAFAAAIARYVESKCLVGGTTTSQGLALFSAPGNQRYYRGVTRNVEAPLNPALPAAATKISDVEASDAAAFLERLRRQKLILHLSEGTDLAAHRHFEALQIDPQTWAINKNLIGIHCVALDRADFDVMAGHGASMVWSPLSNLLLYGQTARVADASAAGVTMSLGADWSPTGSRNVLGEIKAAKAYSDSTGGVFADADLVAMVTINPARMLGWDNLLGSIEPGKLADLVVLEKGAGSDPYQRLISATEAQLSLVVVDGTPRLGSRSLMRKLGISGETINIASRSRVLNLADPEADPLVGALTLGAARDRLKTAMSQLPNPAVPNQVLPNPVRQDNAERLLLDVEDPSHEIRPRLPIHGQPTGPAPTAAMDIAELPIKPLQLDPLTANQRLGNSLARERNLPDDFRQALLPLYGVSSH